MKKRTNKKALLVMALLMVVGISASLVSGTYAKYTAQVTGSGTVTVAKWAFDTDNPISTLTITLDETVDASTLVANKIAPGTSGSFNVALKNTNSEVGVDWEILVGTITDKPTNLKFYSDADHDNELIPGTTKITGQLAAQDSDGLSVPIYWEWAYDPNSGGNDSQDTTDGKAAKTLSVDLTITGVQTRPSTTAITSHVD